MLFYYQALHALYFVYELKNFTFILIVHRDKNNLYILENNNLKKWIKP